MRDYTELAADFLQLLRRWQGQRVAILGHRRPDGDCIGSQVALCRVMLQSGIDAVCVNEDPVPRNLASFVADTPFIQAANFDPAETLAVTVDCAGKDRIGDLLSHAYAQVELCVDHHLSNKGFALSNFILPEAAATAEILGELFFTAGVKVDAVTAQALYIGIATDTGQFRFATTTESVFRLAARLVACGADPGHASNMLYEQESLARIQLLQVFLSSFRFECEGRVCVGVLTGRDYAAAGGNREDAEGLVDYTRSIQGVQIGVLLEEVDGCLKGSLRAKDPVLRVDLLAAKFGGGGHACAAGFNLTESIDSFYPRFKTALCEHLVAQR